MESRMLLLNQVDVEKDGMLVAVDELRTFRYGAAEGEHKVRISGITTRNFFYRTKFNRAKTVFQASEAMKDIGRRVHLQSIEHAAACIIKSPVFYPVVIVFFENEDGRMQLSTYTAKAFLSLFAINSALNKFDKELPDGMERSVSVHSVHDVCRAVIHRFKTLFGKGKENDDSEYVRLFQKIEKKRKTSARKEQGGRRRGLQSTGNTDRFGREELQRVADGPQEELQETGINEDTVQEELYQNEPVVRETREERRARKKAEKLEKKREAARRKYEKLMGMDADGKPMDMNEASMREGSASGDAGAVRMNMDGASMREGSASGDAGAVRMNMDGDSMQDDSAPDDGDDEDIFRELTGMSREEFESAEEADMYGYL